MLAEPREGEDDHMKQLDERIGEVPCLMGHPDTWNEQTGKFAGQIGAASAAGGSVEVNGKVLHPQHVLFALYGLNEEGYMTAMRAYNSPKDASPTRRHKP
jgi:cobalamin biosynthesis protein CbiG